MSSVGKNINPTSLKVLHVSPEVSPLSKIGGLGDVASSLPVALAELGIDVRIVTPAHPTVMNRTEELGLKIVDTRRRVHVALGWEVVSARILRTSWKGVVLYLLDNPDLFTEERIYPEKLDTDNSRPFFFLSFAALELSSATRWKPDIIHCHDWGTSPLASALLWHPHYRTMRKKYKTLLTIHNLAHQGIVSPDIINAAGLTAGFHIDGLEFYGKANLLKGGIIASDRVTTVSPTYAEEITTPEYGRNLDGVIRSAHHKFTGIINGIDIDYWDPFNDRYLPAPYRAGNLQGKGNSRKELLEYFKLEDTGRPIISNIGRLYEQKGLEILIGAMPALVELGGRFIFVGTGDPRYEKSLQELTKEYKENIAVEIGFNEPLAHLVYAGSDMFIMPSLFEPCGLSQLISMRYGTIPIARETGGLADTVRDFDLYDQGNGFIFSGYSSNQLCQSVKRAINLYENPEKWEKIVAYAMADDFSWRKSAEKYVKLYKKALTS